MRGGMLTEPGKASASIAKSNKHQAGACLYQEKKIGEADDNISVLRFLFYQNFFQVSRRKRIRIGNSSSRPASISKERTSLDSGEKIPKFPVGPIRERPGPTLFKVVTTAVKFVTRSNSSKLMMKIDAATIIR